MNTISIEGIRILAARLQAEEEAKKLKARRRKQSGKEVKGGEVVMTSRSEQPAKPKAA
jgi:hypothetical protein